ncbi:MAG: hypothetical protein IT304_06165 [Dehalococcoidia bacterium]|nr:hypothetical protein [Dehalococcoidia bacterium]
MRLLSRHQPPAPAISPMSFGEWVARAFAREQSTAGLAFAALERLCCNAASLLCGAAFAEPDWARSCEGLDAEASEAAIVARRTGDGFKAALADRQNTVLAWPWDHLGTRLAWQATRGGATGEPALGQRLQARAAAYALRHHEQLEAALTGWQEIAPAYRQGHGEALSLTAMGRQSLALYREQVSP